MQTRQNMEQNKHFKENTGDYLIYLIKELQQNKCDDDMREQLNDTFIEFKQELEEECDA